MAKRNAVGDALGERLRVAAEEERRLLKRERRAEKELAELRARLEEDRERLRREEARVERRLAEVTTAEARLRERQAARAAGPTRPGVNGGHDGPAEGTAAVEGDAVAEMAGGPLSVGTADGESPPRIPEPAATDGAGVEPRARAASGDGSDPAVAGAGANAAVPAGAARSDGERVDVATATS